MSPLAWFGVYVVFLILWAIAWYVKGAAEQLGRNDRRKR